MQPDGWDTAPGGVRPTPAGERHQRRTGDQFASIRCWFTVGFATPELKDARALPDELGYSGAAQGSEYPAVVVPLVTQHWSMLRRNLVYTAITRGKRLVAVVGQPKAPVIAVRRARVRRRWAKLAQWLGDESEAGRGPAADMVG